MANSPARLRFRRGLETNVVAAPAFDGEPLWTTDGNQLYVAQGSKKIVVGGTSGVIAGTYGSASQIPILTIDSSGRVTGASIASIITPGGVMAVTASAPLTSSGGSAPNIALDTAADITWSGTHTFQKTIHLQGTITAAINADIVNFAPAGHDHASTILLQTANHNYHIDGLAAGSDGEIKILVNNSNYRFFLVNDSVSTASPSNRIVFGDGIANFDFNPRTSVVLRYSTTTNRWHCIARSAGLYDIAVSGSLLSYTGYFPIKTLSINTTELNEAIDDRVAALLQAGTGISLSYNDSANTLTASVNTAANLTWTGIHTFEKAIQLQGALSYSLTSHVTNLTPTGHDEAGAILITPSANGYVIQGLGAGTDGEIKIIQNVSSDKYFFLRDQSFSTATAANRFVFGDSIEDLYMAPGNAVVLRYSTSTNRWNCIARNVDYPRLMQFEEVLGSNFTITAAKSTWTNVSGMANYTLRVGHNRLAWTVRGITESAFGHSAWIVARLYDDTAAAVVPNTETLVTLATNGHINGASVVIHKNFYRSSSESARTISLQVLRDTDAPTAANAHILSEWIGRTRYLAEVCY